MKRIFRKNQVIITVLALLIAVAGYISYDRSLQKTAKEQDNELEIAQEEVANLTADLPEEDANPGESVLTSAPASTADFVTEAKLNREQANSKNKSALQEIIDRTDLPDEQKQSAVDELVLLTDNAKKEADAEMLLEAKGFSNVVVSISEGSCDVVLDMGDATDTKRAQVEDIVKRKTGIAAENIIITTISGEVDGASSEVWVQE